MDAGMIAKLTSSPSFWITVIVNHCWCVWIVRNGLLIKPIRRLTENPAKKGLTSVSWSVKVDESRLILPVVPDSRECLLLNFR
jgi:hypothetical protein